MGKARLILIHLGLAVVSSVARSSGRGYNILYEGNVMIDGSYTNTRTHSKMGCAALCNLTPGCWFFTWQKQTKECGLLDSLSVGYPIGTMDAPSTLITYNVKIFDGLEIVLINGYYNWEECKVECQALGGRLHLPKNAMMAQFWGHIFNENTFLIGMYRWPNDTSIWYDMDGNVATEHPAWHTGQPNNGWGIQYYACYYSGYIGDNRLVHLDSCLCEVPRD